MRCSPAVVSSLVLLLLLGWIDDTVAQHSVLRHFTVDQGLPSNEVYQIDEDTAGYLWVATDRGAVRYDGYSFENIPLGTGQSIVPTFGIFRTPSGRLYFSGYKGRIYAFRNGRLELYPEDRRIGSMYKNGSLIIPDAIVEHRDSLWVSYSNNLGGVIYAANKQYPWVRQPGIYFDLRRRLYFSTLEISRLENTRQPYFISWEDGSVTRDTVVLSWKNGYIRRATCFRMGGLDLFNIGRKILLYRSKQKLGEVQFGKNILSITPVGGNRLILGFENGGAVVYELKGEKLTATATHYLGDRSVSCVYRDRQGGLWFSTLEDGLYYEYPTAVRYWQGQEQIVFLASAASTIFTGYRSGIIDLFAGGAFTGRLTVPLKKGESVINGAVTGSGALVISTPTCFYVHSNGHWKAYEATNYLMYGTRQGTLLGTGIIYPQLEEYDLARQRPIRKYRFPNRVISLMQDRKGKIWIGTMEGLYRLDGNEVTDLGTEEPKFRDRIVDIRELDDGRIVVATLGNGLLLSGNDSITHIELKGIAINTMQAKGQTVWLGTNKGLTELEFSGRQPVRRDYGRSFGLPTLDIHRLVLSDDQLYFRWIDRLVQVSVSRLHAAGGKRNVSITSVAAGEQPGDPGAGGRFTHQENDLTFHFTSLSFSAGEQQLYRYRLSGFGQNWRYTQDRQAVYTNLPPGNYQFAVQVADAWNSFKDAPLAAYSFSIRPAFWQTLWFRLVVVLLAAGLLLLLYRRRIRTVKRQNQMSLDLAEYQQRALVQLINPHFVFNILNTAQSSILKEDKISAASIISRFARLMRLSLDLSHQKFIPFRREIELLEKYLELELVRTPGKFTFRIHTEDSIPASGLLIPSMLVQPFVENAIKHGILHLTSRTGHIDILFGMHDGALLCTVDDNGIGRAASARVNSNLRREHHSVGIELTTNRLKLLHRELGTAFYYKVTDKTGTGPGDDGTTVIFSIPYKKEHEKAESADSRR